MLNEFQIKTTMLMFDHKTNLGIPTSIYSQFLINFKKKKELMLANVKYFVYYLNQDFDI